MSDTRALLDGNALNNLMCELRWMMVVGAKWQDYEQFLQKVATVAMTSDGAPSGLKGGTAGSQPLDATETTP